MPHRTRPIKNKNQSMIFTIGKCGYFLEQVFVVFVGMEFRAVQNSSATSSSTSIAISRFSTFEFFDKIIYLFLCWFFKCWSVFYIIFLYYSSIYTTKTFFFLPMVLNNLDELTFFGWLDFYYCLGWLQICMSFVNFHWMSWQLYELTCTLLD